MNARRLVAVVSTLTIMVNGVGFVRAGSAQPVAAPARSASQTPQVTPSRLSYLDGDVSFWRPGAQDWAPARLNTALAPGDALYAGQKANVEIQIGPRAFVRAAEGTQIGLDNQEPDFVQLRVTAGHASLDVRELAAGQTVELDTPNAAFTVERAGYYHVDVAGDSVSFSTYRGGSALMTPANGRATSIAANQQAMVIGMDSPRVEFGPAPPLIAWDDWNYQRTAALLQAPAARYVSAGVYGTPELDRYGTWREADPYGPIWVPSAVPASWVPYSTGRWIWDPIYGWTWLDDAPWGWAPYHYGRWVFVGRSWAWAPGPVLVRPVYAPALVAFFGGVTVSVGRPVAWAPLGWGEPLIPWWGRPGFVGVPSWRGWGGPRVVNNVVSNNTAAINAQNITVYRNVHDVNAVVGVPAERFGRDRVAPTRLSQTDVRQLTPIRGPLAVRPVATSVMPATTAAPRPPESAEPRRIVSTRPPLDVAPILRAQGLRANSDASRPVAPRLVPSPKSTATTGPAVSPPTTQEPRPAPRDVPTPGRAVQRPADDGGRPSSPPPPKIVTPPQQQERPRGDIEPPRVDRERRAVQTPPPPATQPQVGPSREAPPPNGARPEAPPARVERSPAVEPPARRPDRAEPATRAERESRQESRQGNASPSLSPPPPQAAPPAREASPPSPQPAPLAPRERPARVEPPAPRVERPARVEPPAPRAERPGRVEAQGQASPALPRPTPPPQPAPTREAPPPSAPRPEAPPARVERPAPAQPPARQRPEHAEAPKRVERSGDGAQQRQQ